ncbi:hypothetical protein EDC96DRAFT_516647 [Choanephora cucurbitarum]|nr:hypothetical protein EDC96DRAFT_516647 [Choanephora cucurbitarum]
MDSDDDLDCPLCMEEFDIADRNFKPCPCGYQICRFCWHHIKENLNGRCPACRREYSEEMVEFQPVSADELQRIRREKREKERQQKDMESANRRHLSSMRVVQKNLVYIIGLHPRLATEEVIRSHDFFGQFGKVSKVVINKRPSLPASQVTSQPSAAVYVTYFRKDDAAKAIAAVDGSVIADRVVRASYGTTKYCTYYLRNMTCPNPNCLYLHEQGEDIDTISKEELATGKHHMRDMLSVDEEENNKTHTDSMVTMAPSTSSTSSHRPILSNDDFPAVSSLSKKGTDDSALPASASWAKVGNTNSTPSTPIMSVSDAFGPSLSDAVAASQQKAQFPPMPKRKSEKKKRKEQQQQQQQQHQQQQSDQPKDQLQEHGEQQQEEEKKVQPKTEPESSNSLHDPSAPPSPTQPQETLASPMESSIFNQGLTGFVLGQAYREVCPLPTEARFEQQHEEGELILGVSALLLDDDKAHAPTPAQKNLETIQSASMSYGTHPSVIDFLTYSTPTPKYTGLFNPFSHMNILTGQSGNKAALNALLNGSSGSHAPGLDSPIRRHSRFGFAQA